MKHDATMVMPPLPSWYSGTESIHAFILATVFAQPGSAVRLVPTGANAQPAFGFYVRRGVEGPFEFLGVQLVELDGDQIAGLVTFVGPAQAARFSLPAQHA